MGLQKDIQFQDSFSRRERKKKQHTHKFTKVGRERLHVGGSKLGGELHLRTSSDVAGSMLFILLSLAYNIHA